MKILPNKGRVVLKLISKNELAKTGINFPDSSDEDNKVGEVVWTDEEEVWLTEGDKVIYSGYYEEDLSIDKNKYVVLETNKVLAKIA